MIERPRTFILKEITNGSEGSLSAIEGGMDIPFEIQRVFMVYDVEPGRVRGAHAHYAMQEVVACLNGTITVELDVPGVYSERITLDRPNTALYIPPTAWRNIQFGPGAVLMALASTHYDEADYFRDFQNYETYIQTLHRQGEP